MTGHESEDPLLTRWLEAMQPRLLRLQAFEMPAGFPLDYSPGSLDTLESQLLAQDPGESLIDAAVGYLGETLLQTGGGHWEWDDERDTPVVHLDPVLELSPVSPRDLIVEADQRRTGHELVRTQRAVRAAVGRRQVRVPGWQPTKERTPGLDPVLEVSGEKFLDVWLPHRDEALARWVADHAADTGPWDFSADSLDRLESVIRGAVRSVDDVDVPANQELIEGAGWYLGEVLRREGHAEWTYNPGEVDPANEFVGRPYVKQMVHNGQVLVPYYALRNVVRASEPGFLRQRLGWFQDSFRRAQARARRASAPSADG